jgi:hypothetical protein
MSPPLDELYFQWLYSQVGSVNVKNQTKTYWELLKQLHKKEFVWVVPNDDNRVEDGRDLRMEFLTDQNIAVEDPYWIGIGCSMLELFVGLSRRLAFEGDGEPSGWFWHMMDNLGLRIYSDARIISTDRIDEILERVIWRTYEPDGVGGIFPLKHPKQDQREVELWYQLSAYLLED